MNKRNIVRGILAMVAVLSIIWLYQVTDARAIIRHVLRYISELGPWGPVLFIVAYILACLTFFPGIILTLGGGILFGVTKGTFYVSVGATLGAACAFLLSRYVAREWVVKKWGSNPKFQAIDQAVAREGWKIVGLIRLSPVFPFIAMNFVFGLTRIPLLQFVFATWFGILPLCLVFVYLGTLIGDIAHLGTGPVASGKFKWVLTAIGLGTTVIVTTIVTLIARRAIASKLPEDASGEKLP